MAPPPHSGSPGQVSEPRFALGGNRMSPPDLVASFRGQGSDKAAHSAIAARAADDHFVLDHKRRRSRTDSLLFVGEFPAEQ